MISFQHAIGTCALIALAAPAPAATLFQAWEFNTAGSTEGWTLTNNTAAPVTAGPALNQATTSNTPAGTEGIVTTADVVGVDPQVTYNPDLILPGGESWDSIQLRFRQLTTNTGASLGTFNNSGTLLFYNAATTNSGNLSTKSYNGTGAYATDVFAMTLTADPDDPNWRLLSVSFAGAATLRSANITLLRFDAIGNNAANNFEVDYVRIYTTPVPEPSATLALLACSPALLRRRRTPQA